MVPVETPNSPNSPNSAGPMDTMSNPGLLSPPASATSAPATPSYGSNRSASLPTPRVHPLQPGSQKEIALINYLDDKLLRVTRRYGKKFSSDTTEGDDAPGYTSYDQFIMDIDPLLDVVWISGTPTIQIPYLLSLAGYICSYLPSFPFSESFFYVTSKVDQAFSTLLHRPEQAQQPTGAFHTVTMTDKVRIKSLIEETRTTAVNAASASGYSASMADLSDVETDDDEDDEDDEDDSDDHGRDKDGPTPASAVSIALSKVYKQTLEILGDSLISHPPMSDPDVDTMEM